MCDLLEALRASKAPSTWKLTKMIDLDHGRHLGNGHHKNLRIGEMTTLQIWRSLVTIIRCSGHL